MTTKIHFNWPNKLSDQFFLVSAFWYSTTIEGQVIFRFPGIRFMIAFWLSRIPACLWHQTIMVGKPAILMVGNCGKPGRQAINSRSNRGSSGWWWRRPDNCGSPRPNQLPLGHSHLHPITHSHLAPTLPPCSPQSISKILSRSCQGYSRLKAKSIQLRSQLGCQIHFFLKCQREKETESSVLPCAGHLLPHSNACKIISNSKFFQRIYRVYPRSYDRQWVPHPHPHSTPQTPL